MVNPISLSLVLLCLIQSVIPSVTQSVPHLVLYTLSHKAGFSKYVVPILRGVIYQENMRPDQAWQGYEELCEDISKLVQVLAQSSQSMSQYRKT